MAADLRLLIATEPQTRPQTPRIERFTPVTLAPAGLAAEGLRAPVTCAIRGRTNGGRGAGFIVKSL